LIKMAAPDSILKKALEFLGQPATGPTDRPVSPEKEEVTPTHSYALLTDKAGTVSPEEQVTPTHSYAQLADPRLVVVDNGVDQVIAWLRTVTDVALDIETHGQAKRKEDHKKEALSFVRGTVRLVQLSDGETTYFLDAASLSADAMRLVLGELHGKSLYLHNAIFDLPRILRAFGVDLLDEDIRDTLILSRLLRSGQWASVATANGGTVTVNLRHDIKSLLHRELGIRISKETDHRWDQPLTEDRLRYAAEDVEHLIDLYHDLYAKVKADGMLEAYRLLQKVYPVYMRQQARGVPFDVDRYRDMRGRLEEALDVLKDQLQEHAPEHPEGGQWVWRNNRKPEEQEGRNGALRALAMVGTPLPDLRKPTRMNYLKKYGNAPLLEALDPYLRYADLESDTRDWVDLYYEDGRLFPNVRFFSQVTGRSAYAEPALQNITKTLDLPGLENASFRDCIRAPECHRIIKADYSAQELRILAFVTGDESLLKAFQAQARGGKDPHLIVGEHIAGKELDKGTPEGKAYRQVGKRANYGFGYGSGWRRYQLTVYEDTGELITDKQAMQERWAFREAWPEVAKWQDLFGDRAGYEPDAWYTTSFLGRRRYVGRGHEGRPNYNDRLNGPIQSGGADQLYMALAKLVDDPMPGVHVIITTHDEVVLEAPVVNAAVALDWLRGHMREAIRETIGEDLAIEDCVEGEVSVSWGKS
jgi:DNA polymerase I-like protein with 3'-5' exonuclease and polymerase domains